MGNVGARFREHYIIKKNGTRLKTQFLPEFLQPEMFYIRSTDTKRTCKTNFYFMIKRDKYVLLKSYFLKKWKLLNAF